MMEFRTTGNGNRISTGNSSQVEIVRFINTEYGIPKARIRQLIRDGRRRNYLWESLETENEILTIYLEKGHMWLGITEK